MVRCNRAVLWIASLLLVGLMPTAVLATGGGTPDPVVAKVYLQEIHLSQLQPAKRFRDSRRERLGGELYALWLDHFRRLRLKKMIVAELVESFGREQRITADQEEVAAYADYLDDLVDRRLETLRSKLDGVEDRLAAKDLRAVRRRELEKQRQYLRLLIERLGDRMRGAGEGAAKKPRYDRSALKRLVRRWKIDQALYERYGGEVLCSMVNAEPVGALQALVDERLATYAVTFVDPDYLDLRDDFRLERDPEAFVIPRRLADKYYREPWWMHRHHGVRSPGKFADGQG